jgi:hypothetical protein
MMNKINTLREDALGEALYQRIYLLIRKNRWEWPSIGASFGLAGGMLLTILGLLLWFTVEFLMPGPFSSFLNIIEIVFFTLTLPMLALGAHCLDLLEKRPPVLPTPARPQAHDFEHWHRYRPQLPQNN